MKKFRYIPGIFYIIILSGFILSCTEKIDIPLQSEAVRMVVDGSITTDTMKHTVRLSKSGDALNSLPIKIISGASVSISDGSNIFLLHENTAKPGTYETDSTVFGIPGKTYTLQIANLDVNGDSQKEEYKASSYLPAENPIDSINILYDSQNASYHGWLITMYANDIGGGMNYYLMKAYKNGILLTDSAYEYVNLGDNSGFEGQRYNGFPVYFLDPNKTDEKLKTGDLVTLEMNCITIEYRSFILAFIQEYYPKIPIFSSPSANIPGNIEPKDKSIGFFAAYSVQRKSRIYSGK